MRHKALYLLVALALTCFGPVLWAADVPEHGVPLAAVEANDEGFGDGPTPFPGPKPPKPRPDDTLQATVTQAEAVYAYARAATWYTRRPTDGALVFHECGDPTRLAGQLAAAPHGRIEVVEMLAETQSAAMKTALAPWRNNFEDTFATIPSVPIEEVNRLWWAYIADAAPFIEVKADDVVTASDCDTGRCDCCTTQACCNTDGGHVCDCKEYDAGLGDCPRDVRVSCNTDEPPPLTTRKSIRWNY